MPIVKRAREVSPQPIIAISMTIAGNGNV